MRLLSELADQLLLGTERRPPTTPDLPPALAELFAAGDAPTDETGLLRVAGATALCAEAGFVPAAGGAASAPAEAETGPVADPALVPVLRGILEAGPDSLRFEALALLAHHGHVLPPRLLPRALALAARSAPLRPALGPVLGARGRWLARLNDDWAYAAGADEGAPDDALWHHGTTAQRHAFLAALGGREPEQARQLLQEGFADLDARERAALLDVLATGLGPADEDFLQPALGDRSKEVRQAAAGLLSRLPASGYVARMAARVAACLRQERKLFRQVWLLDPPGTFAADWKADAIEDKRSKGESLGERAWWLYQLSRALPLAWWPSHTGMTPAELVKWASASDWAEALLRAWNDALRRQPDPAWAMAFLAGTLPKGIVVDTFELIAYLPAAERERIWLRMLNDSASPVSQGDLVNRIVHLLSFGRAEMSEGFARRMLDELRKIVARPANALRGAYELGQALPEFVSLLPASCLGDAGRDWPAGTPETDYFSKTVARVLAIVEQRKTLHRHLNERNPS
jgi:hypothetical protein